MRKLPSGRYQARYLGPDGLDHPAPSTFATKTDANVWLTEKEAEIRRGDWIDPESGMVALADYGKAWIAERPNLKPRTVALYETLFRIHVAPDLGSFGLLEITPGRVRTWRKDRLDAGTGAVTVAKSYRLLSAIMNTAVRDGLIRRNPCQITGAGHEPSPERSTASLTDVFALADAIQPRYRLLVLLAAFGTMRWGELLGLRRSDIDLDGRIIQISRSVQQISGAPVVTSPKSWAGRRRVAVPEAIVPEMRWHLRVFAEPGPDGRVFLGPKGATPSRTNFHRIWRRATHEVGLPELHFHDLRHSGATLAASTGASLRELMQRLGHSSARAALIYQHATSDRDRAIAAGLDSLIAGIGAADTGEGDDEGPPLVGARSGT
ncbi:tyrosine-type recombinase/integrase [Phytoactinopolyspora mesophila]|uniref:tyrosine-type recombinase/integrase n=1 Tax=Phytoactinopolyspora mesophila TaxID=2650750 RepID=UPI001C9E2247